MALNLTAAPDFLAAVEHAKAIAAALEKRELGPLLADKAPAPAPPVLPTSFVREWKLADLEPQLGEVGHGRSPASGKAAVISSQCVLCHRVSNDPTLPAGIVGPDLVGVASRYGRRDLLRFGARPDNRQIAL